MSTLSKELTAIRVTGILLVGVAVATAAILFLWAGSPFTIAKLRRHGSFLPLYITGPIVMLYMVTGVGLIARTRWGYALLKCFVYVLFLAFPVGTVLSYLALSYMRRHGIRRHFGFEISDGPTGELDEAHWFRIVGLVLTCAMALMFVWMMLTF